MTGTNTKVDDALADRQMLTAIAHELPNALLSLDAAVDRNDPDLRDRAREVVARLYALRDEIAKHLDGAVTS